MSLINDALRRANQTQKQQPAPLGGAPLQPVEYKRSHAARWALSGIGGIALLIGAIMLGRTLRPERPGVAAANQNGTPLITADIPAPVSISAPPARPAERPAAITERPASRVDLTLVTRTNILPAPAPSTAAAPAPSTALAPAPSSATATSAPAAIEPIVTGTFPDLKLQGIYYRLNKPSVLINGRTLFLGERIAQARVVEIERQSVTMEFAGERRTLTLE